MKTFLTLGFALFAFSSAHAQIFRPQAVNGALLGGLAGAIIGNNSGSHNAWRGAAIGAGAGLLIGSAIDDARYDRGWQGGYGRGPGVYVYRRPPVAHYGYHYPHSSRRVHSGYYYHTRPDHRASGVFWGGVSGAIVGHNSRVFRHDPWRGAAWGAGVGYVFGSIAERNARSRAVIENSPAIVIPTPAPVVQPQQITINNYYYNAPTTPMSSANGLFGR